MKIPEVTRVIGVLLVSSSLMAQPPRQNAAKPSSEQNQPAGAPSSAPAQEQGETPQQAAPEKQEEPESPPPKARALPQDAKHQAWELLKTAAHSDKAPERILCARALGLVANNAQALTLVEAALLDDKPEVRQAAAASLGELRSKSSIPKLRSLLEDKEPAVVLAAAHSLLKMHDESGYEVFYEILTGERKASKGLISSETSILHDPKKLAKLGIEEGISNAVPFGGYGVEAYRLMSSNQGGRARAAAAMELTKDPDPDTTKALMKAAGNKDWMVRAAAIEALAKRGDPAALGTIQLFMYDDKSEVKYNAAAATLRLLEVQSGRGAKAATKRSDARTH